MFAPKHNFGNAIRIYVKQEGEEKKIELSSNLIPKIGDKVEFTGISPKKRINAIQKALGRDKIIGEVVDLKYNYTIYGNSGQAIVEIWIEENIPK